MRFAFSTLCAPRWDLETVAEKAKVFGYDGVEIRGFLNESILTATNVFLTDPGKIRRVFADSGVAIAALSSSIAFTGKSSRDREGAAELRQFMDLAQAIGTPLVKLADTQIRAGQSRGIVASEMARWLTPLADEAADRGITLLIENLLSFRNAKELWSILEMMSHPAVAACWDVFNAALIGEAPSISVPVLNHRIQYVQVKDATLGPLGAIYTKLGEGNVRVDDFMRRLMGIGYDGWVCFEWEKAWLPNIAGEPDDMLPHALGKLREWTAPQEVEAPKGKAKADHKPAAAAAATAPATPG